MAQILVVGIIFSVVMLFFAIFKFKQHSIALESRLDEFEKKYKRMHADYLTKEEIEYLKELKQNGQTIQAIKELRNLTFMSLLEAKEYIDYL